jgi:hypothetical protein
MLAELSNNAAAARDVTAAELCALVFRHGRVDGHFEMSLDHLRRRSRGTLRALEASLLLAERRDWVRWGAAGLALRAAGIHVAKGVLGLPR